MFAVLGPRLQVLIAITLLVHGQSHLGSAKFPCSQKNYSLFARENSLQKF